MRKQKYRTCKPYIMPNSLKNRLESEPLFQIKHIIHIPSRCVMGREMKILE